MCQPYLRTTADAGCASSYLEPPDAGGEGAADAGAGDP
jgi:hypothetical protein